MKIFIAFLLLALPQASVKWEPDFENARRMAKEHHELILLNFSGSDWCGPCILMRKEYFESETFSAFADDHLILVNADFPRNKKNQQSADKVKRNEALAELYNKEGFFPLTLLLNADGKVLKTWKGKPEEPVAQWTAAIKAICDANK
ncbi:MAG TPA: thioredoxin family protein [Flavobacterium sp.]|nr:thioredoxin family protein [Flavobacterium sp.]